MNMGHAYLQAHSFNEAFNKMAEKHGFSEYRHLMNPDLVVEAFTFAMQGAKTVVGMDGMPEQVDKVLSRYFDLLENLKLPKNQNSFKEVQNVTVQFASLKDRLEQATTVDDQVKVMTEMGRAIMDTRGKTDVKATDDFVTFLNQAFSIYAFTASKEDLRTLSTWATQSKAGDEVIDRLGTVMNRRYEGYQQIDSNIDIAVDIAATAMLAINPVALMANKLAES